MGTGEGEKARAEVRHVCGPVEKDKALMADLSEWLPPMCVCECV